MKTKTLLSVTKEIHKLCFETHEIMSDLKSIKMKSLFIGFLSLFSLFFIVSDKS